MMKKRADIPLFIILSCLSFIWGCSNSPAPDNVPAQMRSIYDTASQLYGYLWSPEKFAAKENHQKILALLEKLSTNFHRVEELTPVERFEPGFRVTFLTYQGMLKDIRARFADGDKDYANWALRGLTSNCISCHSRYEAPVDFIGSTPQIEANSLEARLARAEFLLASRQFDEARAAFIEIAKDSVAEAETGPQTLEALKLWLLIEARIKGRSEAAAKVLSDFRAEYAVPSEIEETIQFWEKDLRKTGTEESRAAALDEAERLLQPVVSSPRISNDEHHLVTTLRATSILHNLLELPANKDTKRRATFLLAVAYQHVPINSLEIFRELYLEQCIREFPYTKEAQRAYEIYAEYLKVLSSGSSGLHLDQEDIRRLKVLRRLAYGDSELMIRDDSLMVQ